MIKPKKPFSISQCRSSFRWSFSVGKFSKVIRCTDKDFTVFPETEQEYQKIYNVFWRFIGAI